MDAFPTVLYHLIIFKSVNNTSQCHIIVTALNIV